MIKKIKLQYRDSYIKKSSFFNKCFSCLIYPNARSSSIKFFSNKQERSKGFLDLIEYEKEFGLKIRTKRVSSLPDVWDDYPSHVYKNGKSWKHNSKRKNQYCE